MPIYEYLCQSCQHQLEAIQKISDEPLRECPQCGKPDLRKKVSAAAFRLKGGGWYETDFKSSGKKNLASDKGDATPADKSPEKSPEKSPDKKDSSSSSPTTAG